MPKQKCKSEGRPFTRAHLCKVTPGSMRKWLRRHRSVRTLPEVFVTSLGTALAKLRTVWASVLANPVRTDSEEKVLCDELTQQQSPARRNWNRRRTAPERRCKSGSKWLKRSGHPAWSVKGPTSRFDAENLRSYLFTIGRIVRMKTIPCRCQRFYQFTVGSH